MVHKRYVHLHKNTHTDTRHCILCLGIIKTNIINSNSNMLMATILILYPYVSFCFYHFLSFSMYIFYVYGNEETINCMDENCICSRDVSSLKTINMNIIDYVINSAIYDNITKQIRYSSDNRIQYKFCVEIKCVQNIPNTIKSQQRQYRCWVLGSSDCPLTQSH